MADSKITALTAISTVDPAADPLVIVDVSDTSMAASGTTKKATINQLLGASGTATLASATISGDLTVDTSTLKVDSANNRVGIGTASPSVAADVVGSSAGATLEVLRLQNSGSGLNTKTRLNFYAASTNYGAITGGFGASSPELIFDINTSSGAFIWNNFGSEAMRLNSTGLGVGVASPTSKLTIGTGSYSAAASGTTGMYTTASGLEILSDSYFFGSRTGGVLMTLTAAGNLGIAVTPSATIYSVSETRLVVKGTSNNFAGTLAVQSKGTTNAVTGFLTASDNTNEVAVGSTTNSPLNFYTNNALKATIDASGNLILLSSATPATLTTNGQLTVNATSNTNLRFSYRGSDGVTRVANITLA